MTTTTSQQTTNDATLLALFDFSPYTFLYHPPQRPELCLGSLWSTQRRPIFSILPPWLPINGQSSAPQGSNWGSTTRISCRDTAFRHARSRSTILPPRFFFETRQEPEPSGWHTESNELSSCTQAVVYEASARW
jgi:hypothetical protein